MAGLLLQEDAESLAQEWCRALNSRNLASILSHYERGASLVSPLVRDLFARTSGRIDGLVELSQFFHKLLQRFPDLHLQIVNVLAGVSSLVVVYRGLPGDLDLASELLEIDPKSRKISRAVAHLTRPCHAPAQLA